MNEVTRVMPHITSANWSDLDRYASTMTLAFAADPVVRWAFPDARQYMTTFMPLVGIFGGPGFDHGSAYVIGDFSGTALWVPPGTEPDFEAIAALFEQNMAQPALGSLLSLFEQMAEHHPSEPHWYLPLIGVEPAYRGKAFGSALMDHALVRCDRDQKPAYLEATSPANLSLYERHGFRLLGEFRSGDSPPMFPMLREPR